MRVLAVGFATYVAALAAVSLVAVYLLRPVAALRASDVAQGTAWLDSALDELAQARARLFGAPPAAGDPAPPAAPTPAAPAVVPVVAVAAPVAAETPPIAADVAPAPVVPVAEAPADRSDGAKLARALDLIAVVREVEAPPRDTTPESAVFLQRGDALLATGDVAAARLFYLRAAERGDGRGALGVARTYDPVFLAETGRRTVRGDAAAAALWYARARDAGASEAAPALAHLLARAIPRIDAHD
jgi:hypothetical protein